MWNLKDYGSDKNVRLLSDSEASVSLTDSLISIDGVQRLLKYRDVSSALRKQGAEVSDFVHTRLLEWMRSHQSGRASNHASPVKKMILHTTLRRMK